MPTSGSQLLRSSGKWQVYSHFPAALSNSDADVSHMRVLRVDGGATKNDLLMQLQVCVCGGVHSLWGCNH